MKEEKDVFLKSLKDFEKENLWSSIILLIGCIIFFFKGEIISIFVGIGAIIMFILYIRTKSQIKKYEAFRNTGKHK